MFVQIVEWVTKFATLLNDAKKLSSSVNRKRLGKTMVHLHTLLSRCAENAEQIEKELRRAKRHLGERGDAYYSSLGLVLGDQRQILKELQDLVRDNEALINIYGNNVADEIAYIAGMKVSLIDVITTFALYDADNFWWSRRSDTTWLPRSLDLMDIPAFKESLERHKQKWGHLAEPRGDPEHNAFMSRFRFDFQELLGLELMGGESAHSLFANEAGKDKRNDAEIVDRLLEQTEKMQSTKRLRDARDVIAGILREHFKMEEVF